MMKAAEKQMTKVKTRSILFSTAMVKAILEGRKSQTRRVVTLPPWLQKMKPDLSRAFPDKAIGVTPCLQVPCADGSVQRLRNPWHWPEPSRLWVRETHYRYGYWRKDGLTKQKRQRWRFIAVHESRIPEQFEKVYYEATSRPPIVLTKRSEKRGWYKRPSIFMPRVASRITLEITNVRVERLVSLCHDDAIAEGVDSAESFQFGWDGLNRGRGYAWQNNPWVWILGFRRVSS